MITFAIHQSRADSRLADGLFLQQQALLRTLPMPSSVVADGLKLWWSWKGKAGRPFVRSIFLVLLAAIFTVATLAAGIFSSLIVKSSNVVVLVSSPFCGAILPPTPAYEAAVKKLGDAYSSRCYGNADRSGACEIFLRSEIFLTLQNASCPFHASMCTHTPVSFDSGLLDVNDVYGLNLPLRDRVQVRKKTTCAILPNGEHVKTQKAAELPALNGVIDPDEDMLMFYYGKSTNGFTGDPDSSATFAYRAHLFDVSVDIDVRYVALHPSVSMV